MIKIQDYGTGKDAWLGSAQLFLALLALGSLASDT